MLVKLFCHSTNACTFVLCASFGWWNWPQFGWKPSLTLLSFKIQDISREKNAAKAYQMKKLIKLIKKCDSLFSGSSIAAYALYNSWQTPFMLNSTREGKKKHNRRNVAEEGTVKMWKWKRKKNERKEGRGRRGLSSVQTQS